MATIVRNVSEMQDDHKRWLEDALGERLVDNQQVLIMVLQPGALAEEALRRQALVDLQELSAKGSEHARRQGISDEEADEALKEAIQHARRAAGS